MATDGHGDTPMGGAEDVAAVDAISALVLSADEQRMLQLYDQLRELQLQISLLEAQKSYGSDAAMDIDDVHATQDRLLDARASYILHNEVVDSVLTVRPILRSVHRATHASPIERDLLPVIEQRDTAAQSVAQRVTTRRTLLDEHATVAAENRRVRQQNEALAKEVRELAAAEKAGSNKDSQPNESVDSELARLEAAVKTSRQRWRLIKGTASAIVVGSGVDWARDAALQEVVLDPE